VGGTLVSVELVGPADVAVGALVPTVEVDESGGADVTELSDGAVVPAVVTADAVVLGAGLVADDVSMLFVSSAQLRRAMPVATTRAADTARLITRVRVADLLGRR
jgi:hypothetical protein